MRRGRVRVEDLCSGPGKLTQALGVELAENGTSLLDGPVVIRSAKQELGSDRLQVVEGIRVGITKAVELPWRFCLAGNPHVSRPQL